MRDQLQVAPEGGLKEAFQGILHNLCLVHLIFDVLKSAANLEVFVKLWMFIYFFFSADHPHSE